MKMRVKHEPLLQLLKKCTGDRPRKQAKLKTPARLQELLNISRVLCSRLPEGGQDFLSGQYPRAGKRERSF